MGFGVTGTNQGKQVISVRTLVPCEVMGSQGMSKEKSSNWNVYKINQQTYERDWVKSNEVRSWFLKRRSRA